MSVDEFKGVLDRFRRSDVLKAVVLSIPLVGITKTAVAETIDGTPDGELKLEYSLELVSLSSYGIKVSVDPRNFNVPLPLIDPVRTPVQVPTEASVPVPTLPPVLVSIVEPVSSSTDVQFGSDRVNVLDELSNLWERRKMEVLGGFSAAAVLFAAWRRRKRIDPRLSEAETSLDASVVEPGSSFLASGLNTLENLQTAEKRMDGAGAPNLAESIENFETPFGDTISAATDCGVGREHNEDSDSTMYGGGNSLLNPVMSPRSEAVNLPTEPTLGVEVKVEDDEDDLVSSLVNALTETDEQQKQRLVNALKSGFQGSDEEFEIALLEAEKQIVAEAELSPVVHVDTSTEAVSAVAQNPDEGEPVAEKVDFDALVDKSNLTLREVRFTLRAAFESNAPEKEFENAKEKLVNADVDAKTVDHIWASFQKRF